MGRETRRAGQRILSLLAGFSRTLSITTRKAGISRETGRLRALTSATPGCLHLVETGVGQNNVVCESCGR